MHKFKYMYNIYNNKKHQEKKTTLYILKYTGTVHVYNISKVSFAEKCICIWLIKYCYKKHKMSTTFHNVLTLGKTQHCTVIKLYTTNKIHKTETLHRVRVVSLLFVQSKNTKMKINTSKNNAKQHLYFHKHSVGI